MKQMKGILGILTAAFCMLVCMQNVYAGNTFQTAGALAFGEPRTAFDVGVGDEGRQFYRIGTTGESAYYSFTFYNSGNNRINYTLYDGPDSSYNKSISTTVYGGGNTTVAVALSPNKDYYLEASIPHYDSKGSHGAVIVNKIVDDFGNTHAQAAPISLGQMVEGAIEVGNLGETDFFSFKTTGADAYYEVGLYGTGSKAVNASVYIGPDSSYEHFDLSASSGSATQKLYSLEKNHTYYVKVYGGFWDDATKYKLCVKEIKDDAKNDFSGALKLTDGKTVKAQIQDANLDVDFFTFKTAKKKTAYQVDIKNTSKAYLYVTLYTRNDIASAHTNLNKVYVGAGETKTVWLNLSKNHTYYLKVTGNTGASYKLTVTNSAKTIKKKAPKSFKATGSYSYVYLSWQNTEQYAGYELYRSTSKSSGYKKIKTLSSTSYYYDRSARRGVTYYYKLRYYVKDNGKIVGGKWTKPKKARRK